MGFFKEKWIVEFEASKGILSSNKKGSLVVDANSKYSAEDIAKGILKTEYSYIKILSVRKSSGKPDERSATYSPKPRINEYHEEHYETQPTRKITPEEREIILEDIKKREELKKQKAKLAIIKEKDIKYKRAEKYHIRATVFAGIFSLVAFLIGWIPHWIALFKEAASKSQLSEWIDLGHSETDSFGQELVSDIARYGKEASSVMWIPFAVLGLGIVISVLVFFLAKNKTQSKMEKAKKELDTITKEYEIEYGKIL